MTFENHNKAIASLQKNRQALDSVAQLVGHLPAKQKVTGLIPSQGESLGCGFHLQLG